MPISTNLDASPYFDDYSSNKDYYKVLFKPGVSVQVRELNQLQTMLQAQIERFGDNIFQKGTIVDGCHLNFHNIFPYVKILDSTTLGEAVSVSDYEEYILKNSANLQAYVVTSLPGFESQTPNLNTLYVRYLNSGTDGNTSTFSANQVLTVFKPDNRIFSILINNGSTGFTNADSIVVSPALAIQNSTGGVTFGTPFQVGEHIINGAGANVEVLEVDTSSNTEAVILRVAPRATDLAGGNAVSWTISTDEGLTGLTSGATGTVIGLVGEGAAATLKTDSVGKIKTITVTNSGQDYYVTPDISVKSTTANTLQITTANLESINYLAQVTVAAEASSPIGTGYAVTVGEGVIYQRGFFQRVSEQLVVVEPYANTPDLKVVGFSTEEEIVNSNIDEGLLDNATGAPNHTAPGADRLKLTPTLVVMDKADAEANSDFFIIAEFSQGAPFKHNKQTAYNIIGQEMARRTKDESGNYVLDQFILNTKSITPFANEASQFTVTIDPGVAYINGYRVETLLNYSGAVDKGTDTNIVTNGSITLNYGSYIYVKELAGTFDIASGGVVGLYDTAKAILTTPASIAAAGSQIGSARVRSLVHDSGSPGSPNCLYRMYLFDIVMNTGKSFSQVKSVYSNGTVVDGVCDVDLVDSKCFLYDSNESSMLFQSGVTALKNANNISYTYRTIDEAGSITTSGLITKTLPAGESWPITGSWNEVNKRDLIIVPHANVAATANISGSVTTSTTSQNVTGTSTTFTTIFSPGDYIKFSNTTANGYGRIYSITNNTLLTLAANATVAITGANAQVYFPAGVPVNMKPGTRTVSVTGQDITISLGQNTNSANVTVAYNVRTANVQPATKTVVRDVYVRLRLANNDTTYSGPWCLGHADAFRLKGVYKGANNTFSSGDSGVTDVTNDFYIDHNQTESTYDTSYLYKKGRSSLSLSGTDTLLVQMDIFTTATEGMKNFQSYPLDDTLVLSSLTNSVNTLEIPEVYGRTDTYYDLRDCVDFRPVAANTANAATSVSGATINPVAPTYSSKFTSSAKKFPAPASPLTATFEYYLGRKDRVIIDELGDFQVLAGAPGKSTPPLQPDNAMTINILDIPPYPSIPFAMSVDLIEIADTKIANEKYTYQRLNKFRIKTPVDRQQRQSLQPRGYTMRDIGELEARLADAEYYIAILLSQVAANSKEPTNRDGSSSINRYKYGYFTDPFNDDGRADNNNPDIYCSFVSGRLVPKVREFNIEFKPINANNSAGDIVTMPFAEHVLVSQLAATDGPVQTTPPPADPYVPKPNTPTPNTSEPTTVNVYSTANVVVSYKTSISNMSTWSAYEDADFVFSDQSGPAEIYFSFRDRWNAIEVYQGTTAGFTPGTPLLTGQSATLMTTAERDRVNSGYPSGWSGLGKVEEGDHRGMQGSPAKWAVEDSGKLSWTHNPSSGRYYKVRVFKGKASGDASVAGFFKYRIIYPIMATVVVTSNTALPSTMQYAGRVTSCTPSAFTITGSANGVGTAYFSDSQQFTISMSGLKPSTIHKFFLEDVDKSSRCQQSGKTLGAAMTTDTSGTLTFNFYYDAGITETTSDFQLASQKAAAISGVKFFHAISSDESSVAVGSITVKWQGTTSNVSYVGITSPTETISGSLLYGRGVDKL